MILHTCTRIARPGRRSLRLFWLRFACIIGTLVLALPANAHATTHPAFIGPPSDTRAPDSAPAGSGSETPLPSSGGVSMTATQALSTTTYTNSVTARTFTSRVLQQTDGPAPLAERTNHTATRLVDGHVLVIGGQNRNRASLATTEVYDPDTERFSTSGSMAQGRTDHTATLLQDGTVLVVGGFFYGDGYFASAERYDPATGTWTTTGSMNVARAHHTATLLDDGNVLVVGGIGTNDAYLASAELYDPTTGIWTMVPALSHRRSNHTATLLEDGTVLVVGGYGLTLGTFADSEVYDPATNTWRRSGDLVKARYNHTATRLLDGRVLIAEGENGEDFIYAEVYDPASGIFAVIQQPTGTYARNAPDAALLPDGRVIVAGGLSDARSAIFDPVTGRWTQAMFRQQQQYVTLTTLEDGSVLAVGGYFSSGNVFLPTNAERFDPMTNRWSRNTSNMSRYRHSASMLPDGSILIAGGIDTENQTLSRSLRFDPATEAFSLTGRLLQARSMHTATTLPNGTVLVAGGLDVDRQRMASAELYDPATGTWTATGSLGTARINHTATLLADGRVLVVGGTGNGRLRSAEVYDPATGTWSAGGTLAFARSKHTATLLADGRVLVAGGDTQPSAEELYDPRTNRWTTTQRLVDTRNGHYAVRLLDDSVLVVGGSPNAYVYDYGMVGYGERYDPATGAWSRTRMLENNRYRPRALVFPDDGAVLVVGGFNTYTEDAYRYLDRPIDAVEQFTPSTASFDTIGTLKQARAEHTLSLLRDGRALVFGGRDTTHPELLQFDTAVLTGSLSVPTGWITTTTAITFTGSSSQGAVEGSINDGPWAAVAPGATATTVITPTTDDPVEGVTLRLRDTRGHLATVVTAPGTVDGRAPRSTMSPLRPILPKKIILTWTGEDRGSGIAGYDVEVRALNDATWTPLLTNTTALSTTFTSGSRGMTYYFRVRGRDVAGNVEEWPGYPYYYDTLTTIESSAPSSSMTPLPTWSGTSIPLSWQGSDDLSGVAGYDVQVRDNGGAWTPILTNTTALRTTFEGEDGHRYEFRVRATDGSGNVEEWDGSNAQTRVDLTAPDGSFALNGGALATTSREVNLQVTSPPSQSPNDIASYRIGQGTSLGPWMASNETVPWVTLTGDDGLKTISLQLRDEAGNTSDVYTDTIRLDTTTDVNSTLAIDADAVYTNVPMVTLRIGAPQQTAEMQISNNGSFTGATWQPFDTTAAWTLSTFGDVTVSRSVYVRTRDTSGKIHGPVSDDIIYDSVAPEGTIAIANVNDQTVLVQLAATDDFSKKADLRMRVSTNAQFGGATWRPFDTSATVARAGEGTRVYAQFEDAAGNRSAIVAAGTPVADENSVFLPLVRR